MNESQAIATMKKLWGSKAAWRRNDKALKAEEREAIKETLDSLSIAYTDAKTASEARRREVLKDPELVRLRAIEAAAKKAHTNALGLYHARRVTVGYCNNAAGMSFFNVKGEGDNWQEAIENAKAKS